MQQLRLVSPLQYTTKTLEVDNVKAEFKKMGDTVHEVILEINSHKFLIAIKTGLKKLEHFEVIAVKGFIELGVKMVRILKRLVTSLYFEY